LLDDLAARFVKNGWSLKWLHSEIMLSATYRQASHPRKDAMQIDPANRLLWRMNPRRLDIEAYRDNLLQAAGTLDGRSGGPSVDLDQPENHRRTVYARVSRGRVNPLLQLYDFPEATMHSPSRVAASGGGVPVYCSAVTLYGFWTYCDGGMGVPFRRSESRP
jgi:hypothetical protein